MCVMKIQLHPQTNVNMTAKHKKHKVLVLGVDERSALTVIRSLGRRGIIVHLGSDEPGSVCQYSRYTEEVINLPDTGRTPDLWLQKLADHVGRERYDLIIPAADSPWVLVVQNRKELEKLAKLAIPNDRGFAYTYNKGKTVELARTLGVPCPKTVKIDRIEQAAETLDAFDLPVIVKPVYSKVWQNNIRHHLTAELARNKGELKLLLSRFLKIAPVLIQSFHKGIGLGQEFLMNNGEVVAAFQHVRVHEPTMGGGSSYRQSVALDPTLLEYSVRMLRELKWTGVAMVEYKYDKETKRSALMEINGRFWGSLPLAVAAGVDFPALLFDLLVHNRTPERINYKKNIYCRNITRDVKWFKDNLRADRSDPFTISLPVVKVLEEFINVISFREHFDTLVIDDLKPGLKHILGYLGKQRAAVQGRLKKAFLKVNR